MKDLFKWIETGPQFKSRTVALVFAGPHGLESYRQMCKYLPRAYTIGDRIIVLIKSRYPLPPFDYTKKGIFFFSGGRHLGLPKEFWDLNQIAWDDIPDLSPELMARIVALFKESLYEEIPPYRDEKLENPDGGL